MADRIQRFSPAGRARSAIYRLLWICSDAFLKAANGCLFVAAGLLPMDERHASSREEWRQFNLSSHEVDAGLTFPERRFYSKYVRPTDRALLVGCGTGRDLLGLRWLGIDVDGLDQHPALVEIARSNLARHGLAGSIHAGLIETADIDRRYNAVIFSIGCYSLLPSADVRVATLARIRSYLPDDGRVILSYHPFKRQSRIGRWLTAATARLAGEADGIPEKGDIFWRHHLVPGVLSYRRVFQPDEFRDECAAAGFNVLAEESFDEFFCFAVIAPTGDLPK